MQGLVHGDVKPENILVLPRPLKFRERGEVEEEEEEVSSSSCSSSSSPFYPSSPHPSALPPFSFALSDFGSACPIGGPFPLGTLDFLPPEVAAAVIALGSSPSLGSVGGDEGFSRSSSSISCGGGGGAGARGGTPLPPAAAATAAASPAADVWAIGAATVDLLTGGPPFAARAGAAAGGGGGGGAAAHSSRVAAASATATLAAAATEPLRLPRHLSAEARSFCELCLRKRAGERPSCRELCAHEWFSRGGQVT